MFRRLYDWTMRLADHRHALYYLGLISFAESSFFPIPPDVMLVPLVLAQRDRAWLIAAVCTLGSVLGAMLGYAIGYFLYASIGKTLIHFYGLTDLVEQYRVWFQVSGAEIILVKGLTPIPFKLVTIVSGLAGMNFALFLLAVVATRAARFFLEAGLLKHYGEPVRDFIEHRLDMLAWIFLALLVGGFALFYYWSRIHSWWVQTGL